ncbi:MAG: PIN domain-containing protein [Ignavibacteriae bacterium]|nr:PIN domain-containing protein [Ignavibacteriota bacterium]
MRIKDNSFVDTNILVYYFSDKNSKLEPTKEIIYSDCDLIISIQVVNEFISVCYKKIKLNTSEIAKNLDIIKNRFLIRYIDENTIEKALQLKEVYQYSYYDSLILASALMNNCEVLFSEDFQNTQIIENKLKIVNPYKN